MNVFLAQLILAARRNEGENGGWMQLLVFVIMAVIWAIGGIIKAKSKKQNPEDDEQLEKTLAHRKRAGQRPDWQIKYKSVKPENHEYEEPELITQEEPLVVSKPTIRPQLSLESQIEPFEDTELVGEPLKGIDIDVSKKDMEQDELLESLFDFDDPEQLRRAILHYEVLGKPLSLREI